MRELPLLRHTVELYPNVNLSDTYIICAQHLVSTSYSLFYTLLQLGLKPHNLSVIGKCYSTDPSAAIEMKQLGIDICPSSLNFDSHKSFDQQYISNIKTFLSKRFLKLKNNRFEKVVVLDDGGVLIEEVNSLLKRNKLLIGIEQTSSGYHKIKRLKLNFPVINVARSSAKLIHESPIIARLVLDSLIQRLTELSVNTRKALIIGNGPIGSQIYKFLNKTHEVLLFDKDPAKSDINREALIRSLGTIDLIIGCTGTAALCSEEISLLKKNCILASASSSDREFNAEELRKKIPVVRDCHKDLMIDNIWLINCGFPINFSSNFTDVDCDELQLTRSLLLVSILQSVCDRDSNRIGFIPLDMEKEKEILRQYHILF